MTSGISENAFEQPLPELNSEQGWEFAQLQLGDCIHEHVTNITLSGEKNAQGEQNAASAQYLYIICQGRVRLLSFDGEKQREVSTQVLGSGNILAGELLGGEVSLPYKAITASPVQIAKISLAKLGLWLEQQPQLQQKWQEQTKQQQLLIFLKTRTELRALSSHRLQQFATYLEEKQISAGTPVNQVAPPQKGRYWLWKGQIHSTTNGSTAPIEGSAWGYPDGKSVDGVAQTDLQIYQLPHQHWESAVQLAPSLAGEGEENVASVPVVAKPPVPTIVQHQPPTDSLPQHPSQATTAVDFPCPSTQRPWLARLLPFPFIQQQSSSDCGATCLAMISQYWGKRFSINSLRNLSGVGRTGATLKGLAKAAESLGYQSRPVRASLNRLVAQPHPWIAHWQGDHYIVVYQVKRQQVLVADPALGKRCLPRSEFLAGWTGYALLLDPTDSLQQAQNDKRSLGKFVKVLLPYRSLAAQIILASVFIQIFSLVNPLFTQVILDQIVVTKSQATLNVFILGALICGTWGMALSSVREYLLSYLANRLDLTMISGFINHALRLPLHFFESRRVGDIITRVQENQKIQRFLIGQVLLSWLNFVTGFIYLGLMLYYNWQLTLLVLALIPPIALLTLGATPLLRKISRESFSATADQNSSLVEMMNGVATVKAAAAEQELRWRWEDSLTHQLNVRFKAQKLGINLGVANGLINSLGGTVLLWYGATLVINDQLTIGQLVAFNMMKGYVISPVIALAGLWDELQEVLISVERLNDVFDTEPEETPGKQMTSLPYLRGDVRFENVTFRYDTQQERNTLQNISFEVNSGETIAIVGRSGSGKTTLVKLLQGLYYPTSGTIYLDEHDIEHVSPGSVRSQMGVVPQECFLFSGTILDNITLYRPELTLEQAVSAAKLAEAHAFIQSLPLGYQTKVGERGANLSGGQRQRIAIARALLGEPRLLVLDEATSSLDTESERRFQANLTRLSRDRTTFIIAHRLSTVRNADRILVLDRGILAEQGNHTQLMAKQGIYYHLAQQQLEL